MVLEEINRFSARITFVLGSDELVFERHFVQLLWYRIPGTQSYDTAIIPYLHFSA